MTEIEITTTCRNRRKELGLTQSQLAIKLGWAKTRISEFENNKTNFTLSKLSCILTALSLTIS